MLRSKTDPKTKEHTLCEPALSKCTWTCHKRHFGRKFTGKMPDADTTSVEHRALTVTVRTPQCGHTVVETTDFVRSARSCAQVAGVSITVVAMFLFDVSCVCRFEHVGTRGHEHVVNMLLLVVAHFVCLTFRRRSHLVSLWEEPL